MKLPMGDERKAIQDAIEVWREADEGSMRTGLEQAMYAVVRKYLPDTSTRLGLLATMSPIALDVLIKGKAKSLDQEDVIIWPDENGEPRLGHCPDPPEDALRVPFVLLKRLFTLHGTVWVSDSVAREAFGDPKKEGE